MSNNINKIANKLQAILNESNSRKPKPYDSSATVTRVTEDTIWVHLPGGVEETPVRKTINAKKGDIVKVHIENGGAWATGNSTAPPTDDTKAIKAEELAIFAQGVSEAALLDANIARSAAIDAMNDADIANKAAKSAKTSADVAIYNLSLVEDVVGTVNWLAQHGYYIACTETEVIDGKVYYALNGVAVENPTGNPSKNSYYEIIDEKYVLSMDTDVDPQKTYYQVVALKIDIPEGDPSTNPYYQLDIDEAVVQYINTHLTLTEQGLRVSDGSDSSVLISSDRIIIGNVRDYHIEITEERLSFINGTGDSATEIAYMEFNELYIPRVVVVDSMQIGHWKWDALSSSNHLTLRWEG